MKVIEFLINNNSDNSNLYTTALEKLKSEHSINYAFHSIYKNLVQLTYDHLDASKSNPLVKECRALILDVSTIPHVVSRSFDRFGDYNQRVKTDFNFNNCKYYKKIDGSIINMYFYNKWNVSTKSLPDANGMIFANNKTYSEYFFETFENLKYKYPKDTKNTYIFEFKFPEGSFLTEDDDNPSIVLIGIRNNETGQEYDIDTYKTFNWQVVEHKISNLSDIENEIRYLDPTLDEGYVVCDNNFNRLKIKSPQYEAISLLGQKDINNNYLRLCDIVKTNRISNFIKKYPYLIEDFNDINIRYDIAVEEANKLAVLLSTMNSKEKGLYFKENPCIYSDYFFKHYHNDMSIEDYFYNIDASKMMNIIKKVL